MREAPQGSSHVSCVYGMQRQDYSKLGLLAFQNNERSAQMLVECIEVQLSFLPFAKLRNEEWVTRENRSVGSDYIRDSVVSKTNKLRPGQPTNRGSITGKGKILTLF
jgi:hypothetical protein